METGGATLSSLFPLPVDKSPQIVHIFFKNQEKQLGNSSKSFIPAKAGIQDSH
jgi:hypothetical protein